MDLNATPPEEYDDKNEQHVEENKSPQCLRNAKRIESAVEISRREREERRLKLKRERTIDMPTHPPPQEIYDNAHQKKIRLNDRSKPPHGWLDCPSLGQGIYNIIPSKVPLSDYFNDCISPAKRYSFKELFSEMRILGKSIGLAIDLTNTSRYYPISDWKKYGIRPVKIECEGRNSVPDNKSVNKFVYEVSCFLSHQKTQPKQVFVHCTHGHNRTGFMIVHYLVRMKSFSVTQAIKIFADARPPGIYKPDYIEALYTFYHEDRPEIVVCPRTPEWKRSPDLDLNGDAVPDDGVGNSSAPLHENHESSKVMTNDDILGDEIHEHQQEAMRLFCYEALKPRGNHRQFPGSHPVSLNRENLQLLSQSYYYATWKADGTRYMMLITMDGCYLIDRNFNFRRVEMRFPCRSNNGALAEKTHHYTLLDGEMVIDTVPDSGKQERRYLIYDIMAMSNHSIVDALFFHQRWELIEKEIVEPRNHERHLISQKRNPGNHCNYRYDLEPFRVRRKSFWPLSTVNKLLTKTIPALSHESDGLIFQGWNDYYVPKTHQGLLKWKYANMNSVDFRFETVDNRRLLFCFENGRKKLVNGNVQFMDENDPAMYTGKIIECSWDPDNNMWTYMRTRTDKSTPNDIKTYEKVVQSIRDNITEDVLMTEIEKVIKLPMYVDELQKLTKVKAPRHV